jgi:D-glycero-D-manno-heptose 1,7-bisphosphate phosphatase
MMQRAIFLDRDGTLNEEVGYLRSFDQFRLYPDVAAAIRRLNDAGWLTILVTNQSGIARGYLSEGFLHDLHQRLRDELATQAGARIDAIYFCPHLPPCECRKPLPGLLLQAASEWPIDLPSSYVIGDRYRDLAAGFAVGAEGILVQTGYGREELAGKYATWDRPPRLIAETLYDAVEWILDRSTEEEEKR